jgi:hypothetical protein
MSPTQIVIPDLRFEESFNAKLIKNAIDENKKNKKLNEDGSISTTIPISLLIKTIIIDQIIMPFVQSFALTAALFYIRPLLQIITRQGYIVGSSLVSSIKSIAKSVFFLKSTQ